ncbi:hypothetical protein [Aliterella atlantica]|uniref:Uncharacterized protein n=1 Tax=Aliterella atlantica CENA595 TaxID=1618023 RepID=A0A0D8ZW19_9CYAN|nr:hypothetical protein [Aliterella atlantica]KJH72940.1 hypothetical protein UH38_05250 [Aliterella atlantica CENA595]
MIETPIFIKVKSVYFVKLPTMWLNLAQIRQVKPGDIPGKIVVIYDTGEFDCLVGIEAQLLVDALNETNHIDKSA